MSFEDLQDWSAVKTYDKVLLTIKKYRVDDNPQGQQLRDKATEALWEDLSSVSRIRTDLEETKKLFLATLNGHLEPDRTPDVVQHWSDEFLKYFEAKYGSKVALARDWLERSMYPSKNNRSQLYHRFYRTAYLMVLAERKKDAPPEEQEEEEDEEQDIPRGSGSGSRLGTFDKTRYFEAEESPSDRLGKQVAFRPIRRSPIRSEREGSEDPQISEQIRAITQLLATLTECEQDDHRQQARQVYKITCLQRRGK